jgi:Protein of unknown function (DUF1573)
MKQRFVVFSFFALFLGLTISVSAQGKDLNSLPVLKKGSKVVAVKDVVSVAQSPALLFESTTVDFGTVNEGDKVEVVYKVTNKSAEVVKIEKLKTGCGCTQAGKNPDEIKPGETIDLKVVYNTKGRRGNNKRSMDLITNDPGKKKYVLAFTGVVKTDLYWGSTYVNFRTIDYGVEHTRKLSLFSAVDGFEVKSITCSDPNISASIVEEKPFESKDLAGTEYVVEVKVSAEFPVKAFQERIVVAHNGVTKTTLQTVTVSGVVEGDVIVNPKRIYGRVVADRPTSTTITLTSRSKSAFEVKEILNPQNIPVKIEILDTDKPYAKQLIATMSAGNSSRTRQSKIEVKIVSSKDGKEMSVTIPTIIAVHRARVVAPSFRPKPRTSATKTNLGGKAP